PVKLVGGGGRGRGSSDTPPTATNAADCWARLENARDAKARVGRARRRRLGGIGGTSTSQQVSVSSCPSLSPACDPPCPRPPLSLSKPSPSTPAVQYLA
ncbi:hypothetical protein THAOC_34269, partial [Thalassiosira oceanica]